MRRCASTPLTGGYSGIINGEGDWVAGIRQPLEKAAQENPQFRVLPDSFSQIHQAICVPRNATQHYEFICRRLFLDSGRYYCRDGEPPYRQ
jgi:hypothetical protein